MKTYKSIRKVYKKHTKQVRVSLLISENDCRKRQTIISDKKVGEAMVELDQFKSILNSYTKPLVEVRDSL